jgi:hypothetical protein
MNHAVLVRAAARWKVPRDLALAVIARDLHCIYCNRDFAAEILGQRAAKASWEHINNDESIVTLENIALCCIGCNSSKGTKTLGEWLQSKYCQTRGIGRDTIAAVAAGSLSKVAAPSQPSLGYVASDGSLASTDLQASETALQGAANDG